MSSYDLGETKYDKGILSLNVLSGGWGCGEDGTPNVVSIGVYPDKDNEDRNSDLIILTSKQVNDLIDLLKEGNRQMKEIWEEKWPQEELKADNIRFFPPFQWEIDEMEKERQERLEAQKVHEDLINNPANRHCASCRYYDKVSWLCVKHFTEQREELTILMRDVEHYPETRERRMELSHVHQNKPEDTCEDWVDARGAGVIHITEGREKNDYDI